ncbi:hypothetical protein J1N35_038790 [Gossypium stocksii]|uniref:DUF4283 domain-containing protein n=1 Tax=Gossypium stocksii TaxID=47602 RepID=A0A9D3UMR0_9ROSI|nr:hypothetical protein J1N35_038790 [Gossypium stocksii]
MIPKKVRFRDKEEETSNEMLIELFPDQASSWRDMLVYQSSKGDSTVDRKENKIYSMWRLSRPIHMMDIENKYFLVKFHNKLDCDKALSEGLWTIFGQYLTVQPWTMAFERRLTQGREMADLRRSKGKEILNEGQR